MKRLMFFIVVLAVAVWVGLQIKVDPGYVLLAYRNWTIETPLWFAAVSILAGFLVFYLLLRLLSSTSRLFQHFREWRQQRRQRRAWDRTLNGLMDFVSGDWQKAESGLLKATKHNKNTLINYLAAARAAQKQDALGRRDDHFHQALLKHADKELAVSLCQAQCYMDYQQWDKAYTAIQHCYKLSPQHPFVLKLMSTLGVKCRDWRSLHKLLPSIKKHKILSAERYNLLEIKIFSEILEAAYQHEQLTSLSEAWHNLPKRLQKHPKLIAVYTKHLIANDKFSDAETLLRTTLKKTWHEDLVRLFGLCTGKHNDKRLALAESWLKSHPEDPSLLLCLGRLCIQSQLWGKARDYLQASINHKPCNEAFLELGQLLQQLGETDAALQCYRQGLTADGTAFGKTTDSGPDS